MVFCAPMPMEQFRLIRKNWSNFDSYGFFDQFGQAPVNRSSVESTRRSGEEILGATAEQLPAVKHGKVCPSFSHFDGNHFSPLRRVTFSPLRPANFSDSCGSVLGTWHYCTSRHHGELHVTTAEKSTNKTMAGLDEKQERKERNKSEEETKVT